MSESGWYEFELHDNFLHNEGIQNSLELILKNAQFTTDFVTNFPFKENSGHQITVILSCLKSKCDYILISHEYNGEEVDLISVSIINEKVCCIYERWFDEHCGLPYGNHIWYLNSKKINWTGFETKIEEFAVSLI